MAWHAVLSEGLGVLSAAAECITASALSLLVSTCAERASAPSPRLRLDPNLSIFCVRRTADAIRRASSEKAIVSEELCCIGAVESVVWLIFAGAGLVFDLPSH